MCKLKVEINLNLPLSVVVYCCFCGSKWQICAIWWVFRGLLLYVIRRKQGWKAHFRPLQREADFHPEIRIARLPNRTPDKLKGWRFLLWLSIEDPFKIQALTAKKCFQKGSFRSDQHPWQGNPKTRNPESGIRNDNGVKMTSKCRSFIFFDIHHQNSRSVLLLEPLIIFYSQELC